MTDRKTRIDGTPDDPYNGQCSLDDVPRKYPGRKPRPVPNTLRNSIAKMEERLKSGFISVSVTQAITALKAAQAENARLRQELDGVLKMIGGRND